MTNGMKCFYILLITSILMNAQQMPIDFDADNHSFQAFGGSGFSLRNNPNNSANKVGQFFNNGGDAWQGFYIVLQRPIDLDFQKTISLNFYAFDPNAHTILLKLENGENPDIEVSKTVSGTGWSNDLVFNFENAKLSSSQMPINGQGTYSKLIIFIDGGRQTSGTYLIDAIDDGSTPTNPNQIDVVYSDLVWQDEFDVNGGVNSSKWHHQEQVIIPGVGWANGEAQHYTNRIENSYVDEGVLNIVAKKEPYFDQGLNKDYTSARLNSKFAFTYGRVDVRAKLPFGEGTWPAIWMLGKNINEDGGYWDNQGYDTVGWPYCGEIDIMEHGLGSMNHTSSALHTPSSSGSTINYASQEISDVANNYHVYSVNWSPNQITFLVDDEAFYTYNPTVKNASTWPFFEDQYLLLNIAMGGAAGTIDPSFTQSSMLIDYVRVYQNVGLNNKDFSFNSATVYPNPATTHITIDSPVSIDYIELYDVYGALVLKKNKHTKRLHVQHFPKGVYLLALYSQNKRQVKKLILN